MAQARNETVKSLNGLAAELDLKTVVLRASPEDVQELFKRLCLKVLVEKIDRTWYLRLLPHDVQLYMQSPIANTQEP